MNSQARSFFVLVGSVIGGITFGNFLGDYVSIHGVPFLNSDNHDALIASIVTVMLYKKFENE
ncbi:hypothetical protein [Thalassobacillus pellis]|uniref:hypothetical protein n=1 Tax=Thalassobacillus pellis TaxID=748008 RepID=UPI0019614565|nr:hypothetical protein [Thalassobacillus pellis]MBM7554530.1 hypothetical protein [Thalassobacillus pellis]